MGGLRKLKRAAEKQDFRDQSNLVWAYMIYECQDCKKKVRMFLENSLERQNGKNHKPVPYGIRCKYCGGFHCYDVSGLRELPSPRPRAWGESYFKDDKRYDCGVPRYA